MITKYLVISPVPEETRASKNYINIFINGRYIKNYGIQNAIIDAYGTLFNDKQVSIMCN